MSNVINLRQKRKARIRTEKEIKAAENRLKHGRSKEEKQREKLLAEHAQRHLEGHKRETENNEIPHSSEPSERETP